jgi:uncharacterized membrane protein
MKKLLLIFTFFFFLFNLSLSQIRLNPINVNFIVASMELYLVDDYTKNKQFLGLFGDKSRLDILWNAKYNPDVLEPINVTCWLNCKNNTDITQCYGLQNCSYQGKSGAAICTIFNPNYNYSVINNITCKFFNPNYPQLEYRLIDNTYPQRVFYPIKYAVSVSGGNYLVGKTISLPINFISYSLLNGNYTGLAYVQPTSFISIDNSHNTTNILKYSQIDTVYPKITIIYSSGKTQLFINTTANELPYCNSVNDCPNIATQNYQIKDCIKNKCQYTFLTEIGSSYLSLPEYGRRETLLIIILSILLFFFLLYKRH